MANSFKQMSMLTSSATRNTIYRSFARGENIGDITAKGEKDASDATVEKTCAVGTACAIGKS